MAEITEEKKAAARLKAQQYAELTGGEYVDPFPEQAPSDDIIVEDKNPTPELSNEKLIEMLNERAGIKLNSLDDLRPQPTADEIAAQKEKRKSDMLAYGLSTGKFKAEDYDTFLTVDKMKLVKEDAAAKIKAANPELSEEAVAEKVESYTFAHLDPTDPLRIQREEELMELADARLQKKYAPIYNLEADFEQHQQGLNNKTNLERKIQAALPVFKQDVKNALAALSTIDVEIPDLKNPANNVTVQVTFDEKNLKEVEDGLLAPENVVKMIKDGYTLESIRDLSEQVLFKLHLKRLIAQGAKNYNSTQKDNYIRGLKGLMPSGVNLDISDDSSNTDSTKEQQYAQLMESAEQPKAG